MKKIKKDKEIAKSIDKQKESGQEENKVKINKKVVIPISILIIVILLATLIVYAFTGKQKNTVVEAEKTELNLANNEYMHVEEDASGDKVPVPNGYVGSSVTGENEIDTGYVIYEGEEEVTDSNVADAQKSRNQYVWIPVPDISKFYGTDANGKKWGKQYQFSSSTSSSYDEITGTKPYNWSESDGVMTTSSKTSYREPDIVKSYDYDSTLKTRGLGAKTTHEFLNQLEKEFNNMIVSVEKYGGFYIGRYETGNLNQDVAVVQKGNDDIGSRRWYAMYEKCKDLRGDNLNIKTGMIWGNQWDRTMQWLIESGAKTKEEVIRDSTSWGNYSNATFQYTNSSGGTSTKYSERAVRIPTGSTEYTKANNIYDLAGNVFDWTMEAYSTDSRGARGGFYSYEGYGRPASYRYYDYPDYSSNYNTRLQGCTLY